MDGDIIVSGSDGLFDNIFDQEIVSIISESPGVDKAGNLLLLQQKSSQYIPALFENFMMFSAAKALAELARKHSVDVKFDSPYSMEARSRVRCKHLLP